MEGKAKEAFQAYLIETQYFPRPEMIMVGKLTTCSFTEVQPFIFNAKIIEWLDTVNLNVYVVPVKDGWFSCIKNGDNDLTHGLFIDRQSATEAAIKKAVEIYNEKYKEQ
ncbi:hypothetical protein [Elizabethkingia anophelis]|uniref:Uncharacterized protein n=1 Tax=Elizabethkingia anophelis TaxID=1117645 RepID=A0A494JCI3_9FLAO|nr:hypothetical protein [Elizabethkingia anophelis]AQX52433.1 hypothetical protein AYC66_17890 [Elizabethkingia anophelis]MDV3554547.1 hypothetical protein [Elizabethkingia anophelis]MDV3651768.1 hypothetical protein [Elizabethkingia anophelis]MDV3888466.1 hypothetical protein [Elizabethkingia anophelis]MDV3894681.1 hypothetical protein [Elizabethkingia anophelis]